MRFPDDLSLVNLLQSLEIDKEDATSLAKCILGFDSAAIVKVELLLSRIEPQLETVGGNAKSARLIDYGLVYLAVGNYFFAVGPDGRADHLDMAHSHFRKTWKAFIDSQHPDYVHKAGRLVHEFPRLIDFSEIADYYNKNREQATKHGLLTLI